MKCGSKVFLLCLFTACANQQRLLSNSTLIQNSRLEAKDTKFKISLTKEISYTTTVSADKKETLEDLNLFGQQGKTVLELRFDYNYLLWPGENSKTPVNCVTADGCEKSNTPTKLDYFGVNIDKAYSTTSFLNIADPIKESVQKIEKFNSYIVDDSAAVQKGVLGLGFLSDLYNYLKNNYEVKAEPKPNPVIISYTSTLDKTATGNQESAMPKFKNGLLQINKRISPVGCSANNTIASAPGQFLYQMNGKLSYSNGTPKTTLKDKFVLLINGPYVEPGHYFLVKNKDDYVKSLNMAVCGKEDMCALKEDLSKVPNLDINLDCDASNDRIAYMKLSILGSEYAYHDGKQIQYSIAELSVQLTADTQYLAVGRLFFSKYEFFLRTGGTNNAYVSAGLGDLNYKVDLKKWYVITGLVSLGLVLSLVIATFFVSEVLEQDSTINQDGETNKGTVKEVEEQDWDQADNDNYVNAK